MAVITGIVAVAVSILIYGRNDLQMLVWQEPCILEKEVTTISKCPSMLTVVVIAVTGVVLGAK